MAKRKGFQFFTGDVNWLDYGGVWHRHVGERRHHFIELTNMDEACGSDNEGRPTYQVTLSEVDLDAVSDSNIASALQCHGMDERPGEDAALAECIRSYGIASPLHDTATNNAYRGIAECRKESYRLTADAEAYEQAISRPVNRIGSTAREYGQGDITSAIVRGTLEGRKDASLMAKMCKRSEGRFRPMSLKP